METWRDFDRATLEREYSPSSCVDDLGALIEAYASRSKDSEARATVHKDLAYGNQREETLDYFPADSPLAPLQVYIHGGYWQELSKNESTLAGADFAAEGVAHAAVGYTLAQSATRWRQRLESMKWWSSAGAAWPGCTGMPASWDSTGNGCSSRAARPVRTSPQCC